VLSPVGRNIPLNSKSEAGIGDGQGVTEMSASQRRTQL
jgi:hypothetical protein